MSERFIQVSQLLVRFVAGINLTVFGLALASQRFSHSVANSRLSEFVFYWAIVSSVILPVIVVFEFRMMRRSKVEKRAIWIDSLLAGSWFLLLWGAVFHAFRHYAIF
jgi:hypothetical protein